MLYPIDVLDSQEKSADKKKPMDSQSTAELSALVVNGNRSAEMKDGKEEQMDKDDLTLETKTSKCDSHSNPQEKTDTPTKTDNVKSVAELDLNKPSTVREKWSFEDIEKLLNFVSKVS